MKIHLQWFQWFNSMIFKFRDFSFIPGNFFTKIFSVLWLWFCISNWIFRRQASISHPYLLELRRTNLSWIFLAVLRNQWSVTRLMRETTIKTSIILFLRCIQSLPETLSVILKPTVRVFYDRRFAQIKFPYNDVKHEPCARVITNDVDVSH